MGKSKNDDITINPFSVEPESEQYHQKHRRECLQAAMRLEKEFLKQYENAVLMRIRLENSLKHLEGKVDG